MPRNWHLPSRPWYSGSTAPEASLLFKKRSKSAITGAKTDQTLRTPKVYTGEPGETIQHDLTDAAPLRHSGCRDDIIEGSRRRAIRDIRTSASWLRDNFIEGIMERVGTT